MVNYWKMEGLSICSVPYAYVDRNSYLADQPFVQNGILPRFTKEMEKDGSPYRIVFCRVRKKDAARFEETMEKRKDKMMLLGHLDYPETCGGIEKMFQETN